MRLGIDVGGTNTDAVLLEGRQLLAWHKSPTTSDVSSGIVEAISAVLEQANAAPADLDCVMIGTTHFTNAIVERRELLKVAVIRIALPATSGLPPFVAWPQDMKDAVCGATYMTQGGYQHDGRENIALDVEAIRSAALDIRNRGLTSVAVSCVFSPVNGEMERRAESILQDILPGVRVSLSHRIGRLGILERENAAIMNACLADLSTSVVRSFRGALDRLGISAPFFISQNDGTLMKAEFVERYPVLTFASGPTNSMRGAAYLSERSDALVADIGGTTTDVGVLAHGFPRESSVNVDIGGVRTNFRMPDILALGLGGGSVVDTTGSRLRLGPKSVGFRIRQQARVFGGEVLTATDLAVAAGYADIGDRSRVANLPASLVREGVAEMHRMVATAVDRMKTSSKQAPLILVGGGAILIREQIPGASEVIVPPHASVANAIGAAIAQAGGEIDQVFSYSALGREGALAAATASATEAAVAAGADGATVRIMDVEEIPLAYIPGGAVRIRMKAVGDLAIKLKQ
ncbi:hydantoinase/oxoprolinase family protein [Steroidobacter sp.]|uniref:hydantoinase/oxoprolinase family protein n=1 Tax=Steroidobacter sp. TaxID=1978227 RepID=UPI0032C22768